jgi:hypothetical protein
MQDTFANDGQWVTRGYTLSLSGIILVIDDWCLVGCSDAKIDTTKEESARQGREGIQDLSNGFIVV